MIDAEKYQPARQKMKFVIRLNQNKKNVSERKGGR
jgi:hypothetical protein